MMKNVQRSGTGRCQNPARNKRIAILIKKGRIRRNQQVWYLAMRFKNTQYAYGVIAKSFHWIIFVVIACLLIMGFTMTDMEISPDKFRLYGLHKSFGITVLSLAFLRLAWRWFNRVPDFPAHMKRIEKLMAHMGHTVLYALMFAMPLSGWAMSSAAGMPVSLFGWVILPDLLAPDRDLKNVLQEVHEVLAWALIAMVSLHALAALLHHFYHKDNVLRRMLPFMKEEKYAQDSNTVAGR